MNLEELTAPIIVGERLNAQGSKKAKNAFSLKISTGCFRSRSGQVEDGASILDVSLAVSEKADEAHLMERVVTRMTAGIQAPLMIDTTDPHVVGHALDNSGAGDS